MEKSCRVCVNRNNIAIVYGEGPCSECTDANKINWKLMDEDSITFNVADKFTRTPGGRYAQDGGYSAEALRSGYLEELYKATKPYGKKIVVELDGVYGYSRPFLEEVFGGMVREFLEDIREVIVIKTDDEDYARAIDSDIKDALSLLLESKVRLVNKGLLCPSCFGAIDTDDNYCRHCGFHFDKFTKPSDKVSYGICRRCGKVAICGTKKEGVCPDDGLCRECYSIVYVY